MRMAELLRTIGTETAGGRFVAPPGMDGFALQHPQEPPHGPGPLPPPGLPDHPPIEEPDPDTLPDEVPNPNPDENPEPEKHVRSGVGLYASRTRPMSA